MTLNSITFNVSSFTDQLYVGIYSCFLAPTTTVTYAPGLGYPLSSGNTGWKGTVNDILSDPGVFAIGFKDGPNFVPVFQIPWLANLTSTQTPTVLAPYISNGATATMSGTTDLVVNITGFVMPVIQGFNIATIYTPAEIDSKMPEVVNFTASPASKNIGYSNGSYIIPRATGVSGQNVLYTGTKMGNGISNTNAVFSENLPMPTTFTRLSFSLQFNQISATLPANYEVNQFYAVALSSNNAYNPIITLTITYNWLWALSVNLKGLVAGQIIFMKALSTDGSLMLIGPYLTFVKNSGYQMVTGCPSMQCWSYINNYPALYGTTRVFNALSSSASSAPLFSVDFSTTTSVSGTPNPLFSPAITLGGDLALTITYSGLTVLTFSPTQYVTIPIYMQVTDATYFIDSKGNAISVGSYTISSSGTTEITVGLSLAALPTVAAPVTINFYGDTNFTTSPVLFSLEFDGSTTIQFPKPPTTSLFSATSNNATTQAQTIDINYTGIISLEFAMTNMTQMTGQTIAMSFPSTVKDQTLSFTPNIYLNGSYSIPVTCSSNSPCTGDVGTNIADFANTPLTFSVGTTTIFTLPIEETQVGPNASIESSLTSIFTVTVDTTTSPNTSQTPEIEIEYTGIRTITFTLTDPDPAVTTIYMGTGAAGSVSAVVGLSSSSISNICPTGTTGFTCTLTALTVDLSFINNLGVPISFYSDSAYTTELFSITVGTDNNVTITNSVDSLYKFTSTTISPTASTMDVPITIQYTGLQSVAFVVSGTTQPIDMQITDQGALSTAAISATDKPISPPVGSDTYFSLPPTYTLANPVQTSVTYSGTIKKLSDFAGKAIQFSIAGTNVFKIPFTSTSVTLGATCTIANTLGYCVSVTGTNRPVITIVYSGIQSIAFEVVQLNSNTNGLQVGDTISGSPELSPVPSITLTCTSQALCSAIVPISLISSATNAITYSLPVPAIGSAAAYSMNLFTLTYNATSVKVASGIYPNCTVTNSGTAINPIIQITYQTMSSISFVVTKTIESMNMMVADTLLVFNPPLTSITGGFSIPSGTASYKTTSFTSKDLSYFRNQTISFNDADGPVFTLTFTDSAITPTLQATDLVYNVLGPNGSTIIDPINPEIYISYAGIQSVAFSMMNIPSTDSLTTTIPFDALKFAEGMKITTLTSGNYSIPAACTGANCLGTVGKISDFNAISFDFSVGATRVFTIPVKEMSVGPIPPADNLYPNIFTVTVDTTTSPNTSQTPEIEIEYTGIRTITFTLTDPDPAVTTIYMGTGAAGSVSAVVGLSSSSISNICPTGTTGFTCTLTALTVDLSFINNLGVPISFYSDSAYTTELFSITVGTDNNVTITNSVDSLYKFTSTTISPTASTMDVPITIQYTGLQSVAFVVSGTTQPIDMQITDQGALSTAAISATDKPISPPVGSDTYFSLPPTYTLANPVQTSVTYSGTIKKLSDFAGKAIQFSIAGTNVFKIPFTSTSVTLGATCTIANTLGYCVSVTGTNRPVITIVYSGIQSIAFEIVQPTTGNGLQSDDTISGSLEVSPVSSITLTCTSNAPCSAIVPISLISSASNTITYSLQVPAIGSAAATSIDLFSLTYAATEIPNGSITSSVTNCTVTNSGTAINPIIQISYATLSSIGINVADTYQTIGMVAPTGLDFSPSITYTSGYYPIPSNSSTTANSYKATVPALMLPDFRNLAAGISFYSYDAKGTQSTKPIVTLIFTDTAVTINDADENYTISGSATSTTVIDPINPEIYITYNGIRSVAFTTTGMPSGITIDLGWKTSPFVPPVTITNACTSSTLCKGMVNSLSTLENGGNVVNFTLNWQTSALFGLTFGATTTTLTTPPASSTGYSVSLKGGVGTPSIATTATPEIDITYSGIQTVTFNFDSGVDSADIFTMQVPANTFNKQTSQNQEIQSGTSYTVLTYSQLAQKTTISYSNSYSFTVDFSNTSFTIINTNSETTGYTAALDTNSTATNPIIDISFAIQSLQFATTGMADGQEIDVDTTSSNPFKSTVTITNASTPISPVTGTLASPSATNKEIITFNTKDGVSLFTLKFNGSDAPTVSYASTQSAATTGYTVTTSLSQSFGTPVSPLVSIVYAGISTISFTQTGTLPSGVNMNMVVGKTPVPISTVAPYVVQTLSNFLGQTIAFTDGAATPNTLFELTFASTVGGPITVSNEAPGYNVTSTVLGNGPYTVTVAITYKVPPVVTFVVNPNVKEPVVLLDSNQDLTNLNGIIYNSNSTTLVGYPIPSTCTGTSCTATIGNGLLFATQPATFNLGTNSSGAAITCPVDFTTSPISPKTCSDTNYSISVTGTDSTPTITIDYSHQLNYTLSGSIGEGFTGTLDPTFTYHELENELSVTVTGAPSSSSFSTSPTNLNPTEVTVCEITDKTTLNASVFIENISPNPALVHVITTSQTQTENTPFLIPLTDTVSMALTAPNAPTNSPIPAPSNITSATSSAFYTFAPISPYTGTLDTPIINTGSVSSTGFSFNIVLPDTTLTTTTYSSVSGTVSIADDASNVITLHVTAGIWDSTMNQYRLIATLLMYGSSISSTDFTALISTNTNIGYPVLTIIGTFSGGTTLPTFVHSNIDPKNSSIALTFSNSG